MKKLTLLALFAAAGLCGLRASEPTQTGTVTINFLLGVISDSTGSPVPDGSLLQIIVSYDSTTFAAPTPASFLGGSTDEAVLWQGAFDSSTIGSPGEMSLALSSLPVYSSAGTTGDFYLSDGESLIVRWYPSLSGTAIPTTPGITTYGQYGYSSPTGTLVDISWLVPHPGDNVNISLVTVGTGVPEATLPDSTGKASYTIAAVPEPAATVALIGAAALGFVAMRRRRTV